MTQGETVILGLLNARNYYGYELEKIIDQNYMRFWTDIGFSSIYNILNKLSKKELIAYQYEKEYGAPRRKVYYILDKGRETFREEVKRMLATPNEAHHDVNVGLVFSSVLTDEEVRDALQEYKQRLLKKRDMYEYDIPEKARKKRTVALAHSRVKALIQAELTWLEEQLISG